MTKKEIKENGRIKTNKALEYYKDKPEDFREYMLKEGGLVNKMSSVNKVGLAELVANIYFEISKRQTLLSASKENNPENSIVLNQLAVQEDFVLNYFKYFVYLSGSDVDFSIITEENMDLIIDSELIEVMDGIIYFDLRMLEKLITEKIANIRTISFIDALFEDIKKVSDLNPKEMEEEIEKIGNSEMFKEIKEVVGAIGG